MHTPKTSIYERNEKLVWIADLMIPDENVDKLRSQSRQQSRSNYIVLYSTFYLYLRIKKIRSKYKNISGNENIGTN